jgi:Domain of unknown function (DUF4864)
MARFWMRLTTWLPLLLLSFLAAPECGAREKVSAADWKAIRAVIEIQLRAFQDDDGERAFAQATPEIRRQFGSPEAFMRMVRSSYYPLYRPRSTQFLEPGIVNGSAVQPLQVIAEDGRVVIALYTMVKGRDRHWRINGCEVAPSSLEST